jgi:hypothetical protein
VQHRFLDAKGTELDGKNGAGRFRVLLHVVGRAGQQDWAAQGVVAVAKWHDAESLVVPTAAGLTWNIYAGTWIELPDLTKQQAVFSGEAPSLQADSHGFARFT